MAVVVNVIVSDTELVPQPIEGVVVQALDPITSALIAQATSDVHGNAAFLLPGASYEVRLFKLGVLFQNPVAILVLEPAPAPPLSNNFLVSGVLTNVLQPAIDPRLCKVQGRFMNLSNQPIRNATVRIMAKAETGGEQPKYVDDNVISASEMSFKTDRDGYLKIDLFRTGHFEIVFSGEDDMEWPFYVPDTPYALWGDLINPYPVSIEWDQTIAPGNAASMAVGGDLRIPFVPTFSNTQQPLSGMSQWLNFFSSDTTDMILGLQQFDMGVFLRAVGPGVVTITGANKPCLEPGRIPYYATVIPTLTITVT